MNDANIDDSKLDGDVVQLYDGDEKDEDAPPAEPKDQPKDPEEKKPKEKPKEKKDHDKKDDNKHKEKENKKKEEKDQPKHEEKKKVEMINDIIDIEFTDGYNIVYLVLLLILFLITIDLWCCVSVAQFKNEPYYIYETKDQRQLEEKKNIVRKQLQK